MRKGKESKIIAEDACRGWTWFGSRTLRQPWFRDAADDSRDERLTYLTYQEVRSILASLDVYMRKSNRKDLSIQRRCKAGLRAGF